MAIALIPQEPILPSGISSQPGQGGGVLPPQHEDFIRSPLLIEVKAPAYSALPDHVLFGALRHPALKLRKPILLQVGRSNTGVNVSWEETEEFGTGETFSSAIDDFGLTLAELFIQLENADSPLSEYLLAIREKLLDYIEVRPQ
jgi:hypothetical protein